MNPIAPNPRAPGDWFWLRLAGGTVRGRVFYRVSIDFAVKMYAIPFYEIRLATADDLLAEGYELAMLKSSVRPVHSAIRRRSPAGMPPIG